MLSIIIPTLNEKKYLPRLLDSIKSQDFSDYEIIVSDGNSEDGTRKIAEKYDCTLVVSKKRSPAHQRNEGAKLAKGDLLLFLDADILLPKDFLKEIVEEFEKRKLDVASFYFKLDSDELKYKIVSCIGYTTCFLGQYVKPVSIGAGIIVKKEVHDEVGGFNEETFIGEDHEYSQMIKKMDKKFRILKSEKILYSVRRFKKDGEYKTLFKWLYSGGYFLIKGPTKKKIVKYDFGKY